MTLVASPIASEKSREIIWLVERDEAQHSSYSIGTWSRKIICSEIMKLESPEDIVKPPSETAAVLEPIMRAFFVLMWASDTHHQATQMHLTR